MKTRQSRQQAVSRTHGPMKQAVSAPLRVVMHPTALIQLARANPGALTPTDLLQLQRTIGNRAVGRLLAQATQRQSIQKTPSTTAGLPSRLKSGIESLSGISMDGVKVHYNSPQPAQLNALAYAQGGDIHLAPGQERHLPHEAWHVVQQAQDRVNPTTLMKGGVPVNDDEGLEEEANAMGAKALVNAAQLGEGKLAHGLDWAAGWHQENTTRFSNSPIQIGNAPNRFSALRKGVQLFTVDEKSYNNINKLQPLIEQFERLEYFRQKGPQLEYWLSQYVSSYPNKNFSEAELKDYLYDDIIREKRAINQGAQMGLQELLTTAAGFSRLAQTTQPFQGGNLKFYRSMKLEELRGLLNEPTLPVRSLPNENTQLIDRIKNGNPRALGNHVGDYKQAISYTEGEAIVEFTINSMVFFSPRNLALPKDGLGDLKTALKQEFPTPQNPPYQTSTASEGTNNNIPGLKSEQRGYYSVGLSNNAKAHFLNQVTSVKVVQYTKW